MDKKRMNEIALTLLIYFGAADMKEPLNEDHRKESEAELIENLGLSPQEAEEFTKELYLMINEKILENTNKMVDQ
jgi:hypothetical protein